MAAPDDPLQFASLALDDGDAGGRVEEAADFGAPPPSAAPPPPPADDLPPPYESVVMSTHQDVPPHMASAVQSQAAPAAPPAASRPASYDIIVADPVKHGEGVSAYVSYKIQTKTDSPAFRGGTAEVIRRYRDFAWLAARLGRMQRGTIVPPLPEKSVVQKYQMSAEFVEARRAALQVFLGRVTAHPVLGASPDVVAFLQDSEDEWALGMARADAADSGVAGGGLGSIAAPSPSPAITARRRLGAALAGLRGLGAAASALASGRAAPDDGGDDPEYARARDYVASLESGLAEVHRQAARLVRKQAELGAALGEFGGAAAALARFEAGDLAAAFAALGDKGETLARVAAASAARMGPAFEAPLKECVLAVKSARAAMADRGAAAADLAAARAAVDAKRARLTRLRGTPGAGEAKVADAERELVAAQRAAEAARTAHDATAARLADELPRFQAERAARTAALLAAFAEEQAAAAADAARVWRALGPVAAAAGGGMAGR